MFGVNIVKKKRNEFSDIITTSSEDSEEIWVVDTDSPISGDIIQHLRGLDKFEPAYLTCVVDYSKLFNDSDQLPMIFRREKNETTRHVSFIKAYRSGDVIENEFDAYGLNFYGASVWGATPSVVQLKNNKTLVVFPTGQSIKFHTGIVKI